MAEASPASGHSVSSSVAVAAATPSSKPGVLISGNLVYAHPDEIKDWIEELFNIPGTVLQATFTAALRQAAPISEYQDSLQHCAHDDINALPESCGRCSNFYSKFIVLSPRAAASLEENT
ncbi:hypothetical protein V5799_015925 [Amblyomma americanum]|uniref:Uncharacterized protein n=1 Tax=Amblyomma americanum TaxID=6943 RepID=A0AAQ4F785_AMBAM